MNLYPSLNCFCNFYYRWWRWRSLLLKVNMSKHLLCPFPFFLSFYASSRVSSLRYEWARDASELFPNYRRLHICLPTERTSGIGSTGCTARRRLRGCGRKDACVVSPSPCLSACLHPNSPLHASSLTHHPSPFSNLCHLLAFGTANEWTVHYRAIKWESQTPTSINSGPSNNNIGMALIECMNV